MPPETSSANSSMPRRSFAIMLAAAMAGSLGVLGGMAAAVVKFILGPRLSPGEKAALLESSRASLLSETNLLKLKLDRINNSKIALAKLSEMQEGNGVLFTDYALQPGILFKTGDRSCVARSAVCTHLGCTVQAALVDGQVFCPCHQSYFDLRNGYALKGPATIPLAEEPIVIEGDTVYLVKSAPVKIGPQQTPMAPV